MHCGRMHLRPPRGSRHASGWSLATAVDVVVGGATQGLRLVLDEICPGEPAWKTSGESGNVSSSWPDLR